MTDSTTDQENQERWYQQAANGKFAYLGRYGLRIGLIWIAGGLIGAFLRDNALLVQALPQILVGAIFFTIGGLYFHNRDWENNVAKYGLRRKAGSQE